MKCRHVLADGFRLALRHPWLALAVYFVPLALAYPISSMSYAGFVRALANRPFADRIMSGGAFVVMPEMDTNFAWFGPALNVSLLAALVLYMMIAAGIVEVLFERGRGFLDGVKSFFWRFVRSGLWFTLGAMISLLVAGLVAAGFFKLAENQRDGRLDLIGLVVAGLVAFLLMGSLHLAYDLSRLAAARHDDRAMLRGLCRALLVVIKKPGLFLPLAAIFTIAPIGLIILSFVIVPAAPAGWRGLLGLYLIPQLLFLLRAYLTVGFWGTELACYQAMGEPRWCQPRLRPVAIPQAEVMIEQPVADSMVGGEEPRVDEPQVADVAVDQPAEEQPQSV